MCFAPQGRALFRHRNFRSWCVLHVLTLKCASRHNGVQFSISHLASWLRTRRFSEPTFQPSGASNHWKNTEFRDFPTFSRTCIFFLLTLSLLRSSLCCSSLLFFDSYHLCFSSVHTVGSLTSKLPSIILNYIFTFFHRWYSLTGVQMFHHDYVCMICIVSYNYTYINFLNCEYIYIVI